MREAVGIASGDRALVQIVDRALAEAERKSGAWLVCRPGCCECCVGPFPISQLDARRLRGGLAGLTRSDRARANRVRERAAAALARIGAGFPGDAATGILDESPEGEAQFESYADDEPCPALDPATGQCDLYSSRPLTCRTFGPAMRSAGGPIATCELCYRGAGDEEIAACAVDLDVDDLEERLANDLEAADGARGQTIVAFALR